jgi:nucleotide-binding universal stress UspA family protein
MPRFQRILVAVDFSQTSHDALSMAAELSRTYQAQVHLLHVVPNTVPIAYALEPVAFDYGAYLRQVIEEAHAQLPALMARYPIDSTLLTTAVLHGAPASEIVRYAEDHAIDLIALGAHGHGFLDRLLIGSVAEDVARHAPCAILMVPHVMRHSTAFATETEGVPSRTAMLCGLPATTIAEQAKEASCPGGRTRCLARSCGRNGVAPSRGGPPLP